jgi:hypothetical protein
VGHLVPEVVLQGQQSVHHLVAAGELLNHDGGRAHHRRLDHHGVVWYLGRIHQLHGAVLADGLAGEQFADVGIAAAAGAEDRRAPGQVLKVFFTYQSHRHHSAAGRRRP